MDLGRSPRMHRSVAMANVFSPERGADGELLTL